MYFKVIFVLVGLVAVGCLALLLQRPAHDRDWQPFQSIMSDADVTADEVVLYNVRNWSHTATTSYETGYVQEVRITPSDLEAVWFTIQPFAAVDAIGHTMLTFTLTNGEAYTFSIEARRERDEEYSSFMGLLRQYELFYSWGTARDFLGVRLFFLGDDLYHYPLTVNREEGWQLLRYVATATADVYDEP
jgi:hypothetical protein